MDREDLEARTDTFPMSDRGAERPWSRSALLQAGGAPADRVACDRDRLYAEFQPLVRRLTRQYGGEDVELRKDLAGEIYFRFCALMETYDPARGVPLRPYLVRQLTASVYSFARQQWRCRKREYSLEERLAEGGDGALASLSGGGFGGAPGASGRAGHIRMAATAAGGGCVSLSDLLALGVGVWASDPTPAWDEAIVRDELLRSLPHVIAKLPQRQRHVLVWRYYEQLSFEEIAGRLQVKAATARSLLRYALRNLRKELTLPAEANRGAAA